MGQRYLRHQVGLHSAALAFYLLFAIFPFLIFISALIGLLQLNIEGLLYALKDILPSDIVEIIGLYFQHVSENPSTRLMIFGLVFSIYFPMRATNSLMGSVRMAYHLGASLGVILQGIKTFFYTILLIITVAFSIILMTVSDRVLVYAVDNFHLLPLVAQLWITLRFPVIAVIGFFILFALYAFAQDKRQNRRDIWPGTVAALAAWMLLSWLYTFYVNNIAHYSALYGSIGAVIVLLIWLNMTSTILIMGAEFNATLMSLRQEKQVETINEK